MSAPVTKTSTKAPKKVGKVHSSNRSGQPLRSYIKGAFVGYRRSKANQYNHTALLQLDGVKSTEEARWYAGKRVAYIYRAQKKVKGSKHRVIWGRIARPHGSNGTVRAKFSSNLPPRAMGAIVRVMLYPSNI